ncbi:hypothetical protein TNCV_4456851 [Trichonephila clavipes]|nr:hypothetical protein TNCV_4456851 [Trichonephila clavipes]
MNDRTNQRPSLSRLRKPAHLYGQSKEKSVGVDLETHCTGPRCTCPSSCSCLGSLVDCCQRGLVDVPSDLPVWVQNLDLQKNNIVNLDESSFSGLFNLTEL